MVFGKLLGPSKPEGGLLHPGELPEGLDLSPLTSVDQWPKSFEGKP